MVNGTTEPQNELNTLAANPITLSLSYRSSRAKSGRSSRSRSDSDQEGNVMRRICTLVVACVTIGLVSACAKRLDDRPPEDPLSSTASATSEPDSSHFDILNPVPLSVVLAIPDRIAALRPDSSPSDVFVALGLDQYEEKLMAESGGPIDAHWTLYKLRQGFNLLLVFEHRSVGVPRFKEASLSGEGWRSVGN